MELKHTVRKRFDKLPLLSLATLLLCAHPHPLLAQADSADTAAGGKSHAVGLVIAQTAGHDIAGLVLRQADRKEFKHGIALFPGHPGIMRLREENGVIQYDLKGNFLLRSSVRWLDEQTLVVAVDAPSDDPCQSTRYRDAVDFARNRNSPLMTIKGGGPGRGNPCMAFTAHGFVGMETETVHAMRSWVQSGVAVPEVIKAQ